MHLLALATVLALSATAFPAAAQLPIAGATSPSLANATPANAAVRTIATYRLQSARRVPLPAEVTIADSAGALVASYRFVGARTSHPMTVTVIETDLVLQGASPAGVITLRLDRQNDATVGDALTGSWWVEDVRGTLRGQGAR